MRRKFTSHLESLFLQRLDEIKELVVHIDLGHNPGCRVSKMDSTLVDKVERKWADNLKPHSFQNSWWIQFLDYLFGIDAILLR